LDDCHFGYFTKLAPKKNQLASRRGVMNEGGIVVFGFLKNEGYEFYFYFILIFGFALFCWKLFQRDGGGTNKA